MEIFKDLRKKEYLNAEGADKPLRSPIAPATLKKARRYRKQRVVEQLRKHDCGAILLYDPCNIRYALDVSNMQVWMLHNPSHYALICADGHAVDFEYKGAEHVAQGIETINEVRPAISWFYFAAGDRMGERLKPWSQEIADIMKAHGGGSKRLAVDKCETPGTDAL
ncbi:MAG: aminopeptidase P family N-terminal domain-containing protein, partial [Aestuariivirgaceae bacterium]